MAVISTTQFLKIADRLAAQYDLLNTAYSAASPVATKAVLYTDTPKKAFAALYNTTTMLLLRALEPGTAAHDIEIVFVNGGVDQDFSVSRWGDRYILRHQTNNSGTPTTTFTQIADWLTRDTTINERVEVLGLWEGVDGTSLGVGFVLAAGEESDFLSMSVQSPEWDETPLYSTNFSGGTGDAILKLEASTAGSDGNLISLVLNDPGEASFTATIASSGTAISVTLGTDSSGNLNTTADELKDLIDSDSCGASDLVDVTIPYGDGSGIVSAMSITNLSGGLHGLHSGLVLDCDDGAVNSDVVIPMADYASMLDTNLTWRLALLANSYIANYLGSLVKHFNRVSQTGNIQGFLTDNSLRVHRDFDNIYNLILGNGHLNAVNVFRPDEIQMGLVTKTSGSVTLSGVTSLGSGSGAASTTNYAKQELTATLTPVQTAATLTINGATALNTILLTAQEVGLEGNQISVVITSTGTNQPLTLSLTDWTTESPTWLITIALATNGGGTTTTTALELVEAINDDPNISLLVLAANQDAGSGIVDDLTSTPLTGGTGPGLATERDLIISLTGRTATSGTTTVTLIRWPGYDYGDVQTVAQRASYHVPQNLAASDRIRWVAREAGLAGNDITITYVDPGANDAELSVDVDETDITINLATDSGGDITTTPTEAVAAVEAATNLVWGDTVSGDLSAFTLGSLAETSLAGGLEAIEFFEVTAAALDSLSGGSVGDLITVNQIPERTITL